MQWEVTSSGVIYAPLFFMVSPDSLDFYTIQISYIEARHCETLEKERCRDIPGVLLP